MKKSDIQKALRDCFIDPKKDTTYRFVLDLDNPVYCVTKACDLLSEIDTSKKIPDGVLKQSITLLAIARVHDSPSPRKTSVPSNS